MNWGKLYLTTLKEKKGIKKGGGEWKMKRHNAVIYNSVDFWSKYSFRNSKRYLLRNKRNNKQIRHQNFIRDFIHVESFFCSNSLIILVSIKLCEPASAFAKPRQINRAHQLGLHPGPWVDQFHCHRFAK